MFCFVIDISYWFGYWLLILNFSTFTIDVTTRKKKLLALLTVE